MKQQLDRTEIPAGRTYRIAFGTMLLALSLFGAHGAMAEASSASVEEVGLEDADITVEPIEPLAAEELEALVGRVALYPDDLLSIVLAASTYPLQVVQASRFLQEREQDPGLKPDEEWDDSVVALLNYPEALALLNDDLDWTWKLGQAVLVQQEEVLAAVGDFRERARVAGNLDSDERQVVEVDDDGAIEIKPADPEVIYVPYYEPARVTAYHAYPVYHYYPRAYPVYYYPYPAGYRFSSGYFWGVTSAFSIGWSSHRLHMHHHSFYGHPYYGRTYYDNYYYRRPHLSLTYNYYRNYDNYRHSTHRYHAGNYWRPRARYHGPSPRYAYRSGSRLAYRHHSRKHRGDRHDGSRKYDRRDRYDGRHDGRRRHADTAQRLRTAPDRTRQSVDNRSRGDSNYRERPQRRTEQSPQRGSKQPTHPRDTRKRYVARTKPQPQPQLDGLRGLTQGNVPVVSNNPRLAQQRRSANTNSNAPARHRKARDSRKALARAPTVKIGQAPRPTRQARSAPARVKRAGAKRSEPSRVRRAPPQARRNVAKQTRSAPAQVQRSGSMQARAHRQASAYSSRSASPKASAPKAQRSSKARSSGRSHVRQSSGNRSGKRMSFGRN